jgi:prophage regulatory protein
VLDIFPVSKSTWWAGVADGRYPRSIKLGPRTTAWKEVEVLELIDRMSADNYHNNVTTPINKHKYMRDGSNTGGSI